MKRQILTVLLTLALVSSTALMSKAQDEDASVSGPPPAPSGEASVDDNRPDPPARAARLQYMSGSVSVQPHGTDDWVAGSLNRPLTNSDNIWADKNSRAEISLGTGLVRLDSESSLTLTDVDQNTVQLQLHQGAMNLHVRRLYDGETYEVDTPNQAFTVQKPGDYRFDVDSNADRTVVTVWRGEGESTGSGPAVRIREGQQARFADGTNTADAELHSAPSPDGFDQWARNRDERFDHSASSRYVSADVVGYEDLDEYGTWRDAGEYGNVWVPSHVDVGWAPYRDGHWIWVDPWGWTWVDDEPWGYAPFHYGRWVYYDNYWAWAPGPIWYRPYYAPALVAWFGGPGWGVSVGFGGGWGGGYGWCPLGFGEPYVPWYGVSRGYFNQVNITNTHITNVNITNIYNNTYINNHPGRGGHGGGSGYPPTGGGGGAYGPHNNIRYANLKSPNGFTAVSRQTLMNSQNVARNAIRVSPNQMSRMTPVRSLDVKPTMSARLGAHAGMRAAAPPPRSFARPVVSHASMATAARAGRSASAGYGIGSRPAWNGAAQRPNTPNAQRASGAMNNPQRPMGNNAGMQRPMNMPNHGASIPAVNSNVRTAERASVSPNAGGAWSRAVPRPPSAGGFGRGANNGGMPSGIQNNARSNVSRPTAGMNPRGGFGGQSVPRPSGANVPSAYSSAANRSNFPSAGNNRSAVPRPSPSYQANTRGSSNGSYNRPQPSYSSNGSYNRPNTSGGYSRPAPSYTRPSPSYSREAPSYSRPQPNYGGGSYSRPTPSYSRPTPSYGGGSYSRPVPSYDRGSVGRSMPSYGGGSVSHSAPSYGGGGGRSMGSYGGGGRAPSYGGGGGGGRSGGFAGGGGGGHASAPSGGGHGRR